MPSEQPIEGAHESREQQEAPEKPMLVLEEGVEHSMQLEEGNQYMVSLVPTKDGDELEPQIYTLHAWKSAPLTIKHQSGQLVLDSGGIDKRELANVVAVNHPPHKSEDGNQETFRVEPGHFHRVRIGERTYTLRGVGESTMHIERDGERFTVILDQPKRRARWDRSFVISHTPPGTGMIFLHVHQKIPVAIEGMDNTTITVQDHRLELAIPSLSQRPFKDQSGSLQDGLLIYGEKTGEVQMSNKTWNTQLMETYNPPGHLDR